MKTLLFLSLFALPLVGLSLAYGATWDKHQCAICDKDIWEIVWSRDGLDIGTSSSEIMMMDNIPRVEVCWISYSNSLRVCPTCRQKYAKSFAAAIKKAEAAFLQQARKTERAEPDPSVEPPVKPAESNVTTEWWAWPVGGSKYSGIDPGFYPGGPPPDIFARLGTMIGFRSDGVVVWRKATKEEQERY